jgi:hypothetical protein
LQAFGVPEEVLTDNGKQFTDRFGQGGEVLFDRICRENGIAHRLTQPASPTTTGKVERFHQTLRRELLDDCGAFESIGAAQAALDAWVEEYNCMRPHQALDMQSPGDRFASPPGHHVVRQAAALAKLVEGELVVEADRYGKRTLWDQPGTYGENEAGMGVEVHYRGEVVSERFRDDEWRRRNLRHVDGRYVV